MVAGKDEVEFIQMSLGKNCPSPPEIQKRFFTRRGRGANKKWTHKKWVAVASVSSLSRGLGINHAKDQNTSDILRTRYQENERRGAEIDFFNPPSSKKKGFSRVFSFFKEIKRLSSSHFYLRARVANIFMLLFTSIRDPRKRDLLLLMVDIFSKLVWVSKYPWKNNERGANRGLSGNINTTTWTS